ncbi:hypothetical protein [Burkholderia sp. BCC1993]|uniref:hypothetical protein n=1 Tax=Burkholderia sp. BCC1993 TaxID=2817444 RepID=UPI002AAFD8CD|nr:hypothetical protein [Burkholderia sp. BCC1993]
MIGYGFPDPVRKGRTPLNDVILKTLASIGARDGEVVEVNEHGVAYVVGRLPYLVANDPNPSAEAAGAALRQIYGEDAASLDYVPFGANVVVFRKLREPSYP